MKIETQKAMHDGVADAVLEVLERRDWQDVNEMLDRSIGRLAFAGQVADRAVERLAAARLEGEEVVAKGWALVTLWPGAEKREVSAIHRSRTEARKEAELRFGAESEVVPVALVRPEA